MGAALSRGPSREHLIAEIEAASARDARRTGDGVMGLALKNMNVTQLKVRLGEIRRSQGLSKDMDFLDPLWYARRFA
jgi:hypothetical protein